MLARRLALATAVVAAAVGVFATSTAANGAGSKCVALVVDFSQVGGSVSTACVTAPTSATGSEVLVDGHHKVTFDPRYGNDFVCAIDGVPAGGCHATGDTHYWVYYHRAPGATSWHVSQEGAGTYKPANTSTEGWVYDNGASTAPTPRNVPYKSICTKPPASASPSPSPKTTQSSTPAKTSSHALAPAPSATRTAAASPRHSSPQQMVARATASTSSSPPTAPQVIPVAARQHAKHGMPSGVIVGIVVALGLGTAAFVRLRRSSG